MGVFRVKKAKKTDEAAESVLKESAAEWFLFVLSLLPWGGLIYFIAAQDWKSCFPFPLLIFPLLAVLLDCSLAVRLLTRRRAKRVLLREARRIAEMKEKAKWYPIRPTEPRCFLSAEAFSKFCRFLGMEEAASLLQAETVEKKIFPGYNENKTLEAWLSSSAIEEIARRMKEASDAELLILADALSANAPEADDCLFQVMTYDVLKELVERQSALVQWNIKYYCQEIDRFISSENVCSKPQQARDKLLIDQFRAAFYQKTDSDKTKEETLATMLGSRPYASCTVKRMDEETYQIDWGKYAIGFEPGFGRIETISKEFIRNSSFEAFCENYAGLNRFLREESDCTTMDEVWNLLKKDVE